MCCNATRFAQNLATKSYKKAFWFFFSKKNRNPFLCNFFQKRTRKFFFVTLIETNIIQILFVHQKSIDNFNIY